MSITVQEALTRTIEHREIFHDEMLDLMRQIMSGQVSPVMIAAIIIGLRVKKETIGEITAAAQVMRELATKVAVKEPENLVDIVGTGGDGAHTFNISTASMFVCAAAGVRVAKHGNRSATSKCGSADVVEALGVNITAPPERIAACLEHVGIAFLFAPAMHSAMKYVHAARRELRLPTVFNLLGPLTNPANASAQVVGVYSADLVEKLAEALAMLGLRRALVVHGNDGLDEITITGPTRVAEMRDGIVRAYEVTPEEFGMSRAPLQAISGGDVQENAAIIRAILDGERSARRDVVLLNAAAALVAAGRAETIKEAIPRAAFSLDSGAAQAKLDALVSFTNTVVPSQ
jgi:anthranilate phosphoribosyltransferase